MCCCPGIGLISALTVFHILIKLLHTGPGQSFNINLTDWEQHVPNCRSLCARLGQRFAENLPHPAAWSPEEKPVDLQSKVLHTLLAFVIEFLLF